MCVWNDWKKNSKHRWLNFVVYCRLGQARVGYWSPFTDCWARDCHCQWSHSDAFFGVRPASVACSATCPWALVSCCRGPTHVYRLSCWNVAVLVEHLLWYWAEASANLNTSYVPIETGAESRSYQKTTAPTCDVCHHESWIDECACLHGHQCLALESRIDVSPHMLPSMTFASKKPHYWKAPILALAFVSSDFARSLRLEKLSDSSWQSFECHELQTAWASSSFGRMVQRSQIDLLS